MIKSLRWRLQIWYAVLLLAVVAGFGSILYVQTRASKLQEIDKQLEAALLYLDAMMRTFPPQELDSKEPVMFGPFPKDKRWPKGPAFDFEGWEKWPKGPPFFFDPEGKEPPRGKDKKGQKGPLPRTRERLLAELVLPPELQSPAGAPETDRTYFAVWRGDGSLMKAVAAPEGMESPQIDEHGPRTRIEQRGDSREAWMRGPRKTRIYVGRTIARELADLQAFVWQLAGVGAAVLVIGLAGGFWLASRIFRPIERMSAAAAAISGTDLSTRIDAREVDVELAGLADTLNAMFDRLEAAFARQQQFTADASHELRTPLAILRTNAELALSQARSAEEYRQTIDACLRAANRMSSLVQGLLTLARADAGNPGMKCQPVSFDKIVQECVALFQPLADEKNIAITSDLHPCTIDGDGDALGQLVSNLLSNAIQHNQAGGSVHVRLSAVDRGAVLSVADTGPGIAEKDRSRIFERFFRVDKARTRASGGTGLGLAICKAIAEAHGGTIEFESRENKGTTFFVCLPARMADARIMEVPG